MPSASALSRRSFLSSIEAQPAESTIWTEGPKPRRSTSRSLLASSSTSLFGGFTAESCE